MSVWFFNTYMGEVMKEVKRRIGRMGMRFVVKGSEWRLPGLLYADDMALCGDSLSSEDDDGAFY